jgi:hypothetical protein
MVAEAHGMLFPPLLLISLLPRRALRQYHLDETLNFISVICGLVNVLETSSPPQVWFVKERGGEVRVAVPESVVDAFTRVHRRGKQIAHHKIRRR